MILRASARQRGSRRSRGRMVTFTLLFHVKQSAVAGPRWLTAAAEARRAASAPERRSPSLLPRPSRHGAPYRTPRPALCPASGALRTTTPALWPDLHVSRETRHQRPQMSRGWAGGKRPRRPAQSPSRRLFHVKHPARVRVVREAREYRLLSELRGRAGRPIPNAESRRTAPPRSARRLRHRGLSTSLTSPQAGESTSSVPRRAERCPAPVGAAQNRGR